MPVNFQPRLQTSLSAYLARSTSARPELRLIINNIVRALPETVIFGGMIREFALGNARSFHSDIDLVSLSPLKEIEKAAQRFNPAKNKFGGIRFIIDKQRFDVWALHDTWAIRGGFVVGDDFNCLLKTTFFNIDSAFYHVSRRQLTCLDGYEQFISERILDVNLAENPNPENMAQRALWLVLNRQMGLSVKLAEFVVRNASQSRMNWVESRLFRQLKTYVSTGGATVFRFEPQTELPA